MGQPVIYVIEDETICRSFRRLITSVVFAVRTFLSGETFLNQGCQNLSGGLLLDVRMPKSGGLEPQERLNISGCKMPVIFMTAHQDPGTRDKAIHAGAIAVLQKPFENPLFK